MRLRVNIFHGALGVRGGGVPVESVLLAIPYSMEFCCISPGRWRVTVDACLSRAFNPSGVVLLWTRARNSSMQQKYSFVNVSTSSKASRYHTCTLVMGAVPQPVENAPRVALPAETQDSQQLEWKYFLLAGTPNVNVLGLLLPTTA